MHRMEVEIAKKLVSFVRENPGVTVEQLVQNVPEITDPDLRDFAIEGCSPEDGFLIKIDDGRVQLGGAAYLVESKE